MKVGVGRYVMCEIQLRAAKAGGQLLLLGLFVAVSRG